ncbi:MAG: hypothetical protein H6765_06505 [Candidatus Peribacteria bacterium]|nr:MAG: hypothetical protein H6765_06505 [Candidatus Peribacteria bacterium]
MHSELDAHATELQKKLKEYYDMLSKQLDDVEAIPGGVARMDVLQCLGLIDEDLNLDKQMSDVYKQLSNQIGITEADIHSSIAALENKIDNKLLDALMEKLEKSSADNKVSAFYTEYDNVVETFKTLFQEYISDTDSLVESTSASNKSLLEGYDERIAAYEALEAAYENFVKKSSFAGVVAGPNIQELYDLRDALHGYYESLLRSAWHDQVVVFVPRYAEERAQLAEITQ